MDRLISGCGFAQSVSNLGLRSNTTIGARCSKNTFGSSARLRIAALAGASIISMMAADIARADEVADLKREIRALTERVAKVEKEKAETKAKAMENVDAIAREAAAAIVQHFTGKPADPKAVAAAVGSTKA